MRRQPNLVRRHNVFYFRCRVPSDLAAKVGRKELSRSLKTSNNVLASVRAAAIALQIQFLWHDLRQAMTENEIEKLVDRWLREQLTADLAARGKIDFARDHTRAGEDPYEVAAEMFRSESDIRLEEWQEIVQRGRWYEARHIANALLTQNGLKKEEATGWYNQLLIALCLAQRQFHATRRDRSEGVWEEPPQFRLFGAEQPLVAPIPALQSVPASTAIKPTPLGDVIEGFLVEKRRISGLSPKRLMDFDAALAMMSRFFGSGRPVNEIDKLQIGALRQLLTKLPSNFTKRFPGTELGEIADIAAAKGLATLRATTINQKYLSIFDEFFKWCVDNGYRTENPVAGVRIKEKLAGKPHRGTFNIDELRKIFGAPVFVGCQSPGRLYEPGEHRIRDHHFWLPLLALFTGARLGELCQLEGADVCLTDGAWVLDINEQGEKHLKTDAARRKVPVHPELQALGFLEFSRSARGSKQARLFPEIQPGKSGYLSDNPSKWFRRFLKITLGGQTVRDRRLVFHSFRHTMKDALRAAGINEGVQDAILGHEGKGIGAVYGEGYKPPRLLEEISKVTYAELDLSSLRPASAKS